MHQYNALLFLNDRVWPATEQQLNEIAQYLSLQAPHVFIAYYLYTLNM